MKTKLATISALPSIAGFQSQLSAQENYAMNVGIPESLAHDFVKIFASKAGEVEADNAASVLQDVLQNRKAAGSSN